MASQLTVRNVNPELAKRLKDLARERGESLNATALWLLKSALGLSDRKEELSRLQTWTEDDVREFDEILKEMRKVDEDMWS